jgi:hypothetical protein
MRACHQPIPLEPQILDLTSPLVIHQGDINHEPNAVETSTAIKGDLSAIERPVPCERMAAISTGSRDFGILFHIKSSGGEQGRIKNKWSRFLSFLG